MAGRRPRADPHSGRLLGRRGSSTAARRRISAPSSPASRSTASARRSPSSATLSGYDCELGRPLNGGGVVRPRGRAARRRLARRGRAASRSRPAGRPPSKSASACAAICAGVPEKAKRSSVSSSIEPRGALSVARRDACGERRQQVGVERHRRVERRHDVEVHRHAAPRELARPRAVAVGDRHGARHEPDCRRSEPLAREPHQGRVRGAAELQLVGSSAAKAVSLGDHVPTSSGTRSRSGA